MFDRNESPVIIALRFSLDAPNLQTEALFLTPNDFENWRSDFIVLGFLVGSYWLGVIEE